MVRLLYCNLGVTCANYRNRLLACGAKVAYVWLSLTFYNLRIIHTCTLLYRNTHALTDQSIGVGKCGRGNEIIILKFGLGPQGR